MRGISIGGLVIDHCLVQDADSSTGEFFVIKTSGVKIRFCTFINVRAYLQQRAGGGWEVRSCWFESMTRLRTPEVLRRVGGRRRTATRDRQPSRQSGHMDRSRERKR